MSWDRINAPKIPSTKADITHKDAKYWFKDMVSTANSTSGALPLMECPLTGRLMVGRVHSGWYYVAEEVQKQYQIWSFESAVLESPG